MKKEHRELLKRYYTAPKPQEAQAFIRGLCAPRRRTGAMLLVQLHYIPKSAWLLSLFLFALMLCVGSVLQVSYAGSVYALVPFLGTVTIGVSMRSCRCHMAELECTTLFSLGSVIMMRMLLLGLGNLLMLAVLAVFLKPAFFLAEFVYILAPYLLSALASLAVYRRCPQREAGYMSLAASVAVAALELFVTKSGAFLFEEGYVGVWVFVCAALAALLASQIQKSARWMEDLVWN